MTEWYAVILNHPTRKHAIVSLGIKAANSEQEACAEKAAEWDLPVERLSAFQTDPTR